MGESSIGALIIYPRYNQRVSYFVSCEGHILVYVRHYISFGDSTDLVWTEVSKRECDKMCVCVRERKFIHGRPLNFAAPPLPVVSLSVRELSSAQRFKMTIEIDIIWPDSILQVLWIRVREWTLYAEYRSLSSHSWGNIGTILSRRYLNLKCSWIIPISISSRCRPTPRGPRRIRESVTRCACARVQQIQWNLN